VKLPQDAHMCDTRSREGCKKVKRFPELAFATPRKLPKASELRGRVVVLDLAFASQASGGGYEKITRPLIVGLGARLAAWVDHHDHERHIDYADDPRFLLATKKQHGACPEMITREVVERAGEIDTIVCHTDFDGLASAAKWIRLGEEPYSGCDDDARAIDTRIGKPSPTGVRFDRALRARPRDHALFGLVVRHLAHGLEDVSLWKPIDEAAHELVAIESRTAELASKFRVVPLARRPLLPTHVTSLAFVDATGTPRPYDKTQLLLAGQERASIAAVVDRDNVSFAAPFDSGVDFLTLLGLSGGMPTLVSIASTRTWEALELLGVTRADLTTLLA
jgi:hypothetical protein